jgi:DNA adenine methylase
MMHWMVSKIHLTHQRSISYCEQTMTSPIVNVASVPNRSPFRYPGGKTWLIPRIRQWLSSAPRKRELIEVFAGGAAVGLTAAFEDLVDHVILVELDDAVAAVWQTILSDDGPWLADAIEHFELTPAAIDTLFALESPSPHEHALQTIVRNRINRGGILAPGAGRLKLGESGKGLHSRWYPETLKRRIMQIHALRHRFTFQHADGLDFLRQHEDRSDAVFFIDPPYSVGGKKAGKRLYRCFDVDHEVLFDLASRLKADFLMTYDNAEEVITLAKQHHLECEPVAMKNTHHAKMTELLICRDVSWLGQNAKS